MYFLLITIVLGFTIPVLDFGDEPSGQVEQRVCQTDSDCYLVCEDEPVKVLCSQNLCKQNSCEESALYPFQEEGVTFSLEIEGREVVVADGELFVIVEDDLVTLHTSEIYFGHVLEKFWLDVDDVEMTVNGERVYSVGNYLPQEDDVVKLVIV